MNPPIKPDLSECCNSGCNPCILDVYEEKLKKYEERLMKSQNAKLQLKAFQNCICPTSYNVFKLISREKHKHDTYFYRFEYCRPNKETENIDIDKRLFYKPGQHFLLKAANSDGEFTRAYTPIPYKEYGGSLTFTILVRIYKAGKMSTHLCNLKCGQETLWRGPYCDFSVNYALKNILFIAQGTGIAPIFAIIKDILSNENCDSFLNLFFCCRNIGDILLRNEIYDLQANWNFQYEIFLSDVHNEVVKYNEIIHDKRLEKCDIMRYFENKLKDSLQVLICGGEHFENCMKDYLTDLNVKDENIYVFQ